jgi:hypothetical protein
MLKKGSNLALNFANRENLTLLQRIFSEKWNAPPWHLGKATDFL